MGHDLSPRICPRNLGRQHPAGPLFTAYSGAFISTRTESSTWLNWIQPEVVMVGDVAEEANTAATP